MIKVDDLFVSYNGNTVVEDVNFNFSEGSLIGIIGPNGAGKSTMIKAILGLIDKDSGSVSIFDEDIESQRKRISYIAQRSDVDWDFPINVFDTVLMGTYPNLGIFKRPKKADKEKAAEAIKRVKMDEYSKQQIGQLSGGQQQRVFIARALAQDADILFLDEPFIGVDTKTEKEIIDILKELRDEGKLVFIVNHDLSKIEDYFDELILINKRIIEIGTVQDVFVYSKMKEAYESDIAMPRMNGGSL